MHGSSWLNVIMTMQTRSPLCKFRQGALIKLLQKVCEIPRDFKARYKLMNIIKWA